MADKTNRAKAFRAQNTFKWLLPITGVGGAFAIFVGSLEFFINKNFNFAATVIATILAIYISLAALLYTRANALPFGHSKARTFFAAEKLLQAITFTIFSTLLSVVFFSAIYYFSPETFTLKKENPWIFVFLIPIILLIFGHTAFYDAFKIIYRDFCTPTSFLNFARRIDYKKHLYNKKKTD